MHRADGAPHLIELIWIVVIHRPFDGILDRHLQEEKVMALSRNFHDGMTGIEKMPKLQVFLWFAYLTKKCYIPETPIEARGTGSLWDYTQKWLIQVYNCGMKDLLWPLYAIFRAWNSIPGRAILWHMQYIMPPPPSPGCQIAGHG